MPIRSISAKSSSRGVAGEDVREARLDADADEREPAGLLPALGLRELRVAELHAPLARPRASSPCRGRCSRRRTPPAKIARVEARIDRVQDRVRPLGPGELRDRGRHPRRRRPRRRSAGRRSGRPRPAPGLRRRRSGPSARRSRAAPRPPRRPRPTPPAPITRTRTEREPTCHRLRPWRGCGPRTSTSSQGSATPGCARARTRSRTSSGRSTASENEYRQSIWLAATDGSSPAAAAHERRQRRPAALVARRRPARVRRQARRREGARRQLYVMPMGGGEAAVPDRAQGRRRRAGLVAGRDADRLLGARAPRGVRGGGRQEARAAPVHAAALQARLGRLDGRPAAAPLRRPRRRLGRGEADHRRRLRGLRPDVDARRQEHRVLLGTWRELGHRAEGRHLRRPRRRRRADAR